MFGRRKEPKLKPILMDLCIYIGYSRTNSIHAINKTVQTTTVQTTTAQTMTAQTATAQHNQTTTAQHGLTMAIQPKPVHNRRNTQPTKVSCPAGCGIEFVGKDPRLGVLRHLRTYAKQWNQYQEAPKSDKVRQAL